jgi:hypothetical protein
MDWQPIETFEEHAEVSWVSDVGTVYYKPVLIYGPSWGGGWTFSPYEEAHQDLWTGPPSVSIGDTWKGRGFFTVGAENAPTDYDGYVKATHWMPVPEPPLASDRPPEQQQRDDSGNS